MGEERCELAEAGVCRPGYTNSYAVCTEAKIKWEHGF